MKRPCTFTHRVRNPEGVSGGGGPPHHQVGEAGDPEDAAEESDREPLASCKVEGRDEYQCTAERNIWACPQTE